MKKKISCILFLLCLLISAVACAGDVEGNITWQYNNFIGTKPDVGAGIYMYKEDKRASDLFADKTEEDKFLKGFVSTDGAYYAEADGYGHYKIRNLPEGQYIIYVVSRKTTRNFSDQRPLMAQWDVLYKYTHYTSKDYYAITFANVYKSVVGTVYVPASGEETFSHDFGNTYI
ncbi:hypothetical protein [Anaerovibrio sp. RM50]|uniref:hypothetical protein n=1 Tax=Anaerovibrio sp. RM50 TaxID=1200557 RepID=UPI000684E8C0|nr:hypothetical protein [Anaerovibrio sp. RM50]